MSVGSFTGRRWGAVAVIALAVFLVPAGAAVAAKSTSTSTSCSPRRPCTTADTTAPTASIASPGQGATVAGTVAVTGSASDNTSVAKVEVQVDGGAWTTASGTTSWSSSVDTTAYSNGSHTVTARATDTAGNAASVAVMVNVDNTTTTSGTGTTPSNGTPVASPALAPGTIGGWTFTESDRNGVYDTNEQPLANQHVYLYDGSGTYLANAYSDSTGWYAFGGLANGSYVVKFAPAAWWLLWKTWVPDTTGSVYPTIAVSLNGSARADFGWRPIVRSTSSASPISTYTGANGLVVKSYDDVVSAQTVYDHLMTGSLVGPEAQYITVLFDLGAGTESYGFTTTMAVRSNGAYTSYTAASYINYTSWLNQGDYPLFHEYGHAWSLYYTYMLQQDGGLGAYLQARGLFGDSRLYSSYAWDPKEMIAEDYRQLFGDASAQTGGQLNKDIPLASQVAGLKDFLMGAFRQAGTGPVQSTLAPRALSGSATVGQTLTETNPGEWMGASPRTFSYAWQRCDSSGANCVTVASGTYYASNGANPSYTLTSADSGSTVRILVTVANSVGGASAPSPASAVVG
jgi:Bacterial Ig domain/SdrD B-like domain